MKTLRNGATLHRIPYGLPSLIGYTTNAIRRPRFHGALTLYIWRPTGGVFVEEELAVDEYIFGDDLEKQEELILDEYCNGSRKALHSLIPGDVVTSDVIDLVMGKLAHEKDSLTCGFWEGITGGFRANFVNEKRYRRIIKYDTKSAGKDELYQFRRVTSSPIVTLTQPQLSLFSIPPTQPRRRPRSAVETAEEEEEPVLPWRSCAVPSPHFLSLLSANRTLPRFAVEAAETIAVDDDAVKGGATHISVLRCLVLTKLQNLQVCGYGLSSSYNIKY
ncbi:hypothetical protein PIB30_028404 [Stylosanthes scabra]|uniref:Uncharacterized protein n=1 Tax=Stylosanthes scabra TaxID=79078 RepID=A0ABU6U9R8_9FABA|nr:hypothetical protein [Stylosanthes scabra]